MSKVKKDMNVSLIVALLSSVLFVVGIPMIVVFAGEIWVLMALGIIFVVFGFYGGPLLWMRYASFFKLKRVVEAVMEENLTTNKEIAQQLQISEKETKSLITKAINKKYITGYLYDGETLTLNNKEKPKRKIEKHRCLNCGGKLEEQEEFWHCPYCGDNFPKEK